MQQVMTVMKSHYGHSDSYVEVECPHCGSKNRLYRSTLTQYAPQIVHCDVETGGCERPFMVRAEILAEPVRLQIGFSLHDFYTLPAK